MQLNIVAKDIITAMSKKIGTFSMSDKQIRQINGRDFSVIQGTLINQGKAYLLTSSVTLSPRGTIFVQVLSVKGGEDQHNYFAKKIINTIEVQ
ncbi:hypothetical protein [Intestinirhabdus alba]|uniref:hypothetical protein n=1 Tax=Intestinirhabdus alba TaxID=2899544 RepID=UPI00142EAC4C|nr:hypothetical protein [Intestinirhabdus alba]